MLSPKISLKKPFITGLAALLLLCLPIQDVSFADAPQPCTPPAQGPSGPDAATFIYQCAGQYSGDWLNSHYAYDPSSGNRTALDPSIYTYNNGTKLWDTTVWDFNADQNAYQAGTVSVATPPTGATTVGGPTTDTTTTTDQDTTNTEVDNTIDSVANSGNATVNDNGTGGSATSGDARAVANVINLLQSSSNIVGAADVITFTANINGDVNGDLMLDPSQLSNIQSSTNSPTNNVTVNNSVDSAINNTINVVASSGNAAVTNNDTAGNATSGSASAVANIVNILNSVVTAGKSFVGVININGNLNGDILLPPNFIDTLLASNVPHYTTNDPAISTNLSVTNTNNQSINNLVNAKATSGAAAVDNNQLGGNATTGSANTNITVFNLTGASVMASNDLLVFVNVQGSWYGMIVNAPIGATAASLGGDVTDKSQANSTVTINNTTTQTVTNTVNVTAKTGDATVADNNTAGDATTGDAKANVNLVNMLNDNLSLSGWFGLLFINVFGTWNGSFGINTSAGDPPVAPTSTSTTNSDTSSKPVFKFVGVVPGATNKDYSVPANSSTGTVLAAKTAKVGIKLPSVRAVTPTEKTANHLLLPLIGGAFALLILFAGERNRSLHRNTKA